MSPSPAPAFVRKSSAPWDRLRPVKQDPLEALGYVSKGDNRLVDIKVQESFYHKIVARYMQFCTRHSKDLDAAFASLSLSTSNSVSAVGSTLLPNQAAASMSSRDLLASKWASPPAIPTENASLTGTTTRPPSSIPMPPDELSTILTALRKLREGLLAASPRAVSPVFSQRVHVFNIRVAILAHHSQSYHPSLSYLLSTLHTKAHPLSDSELQEMTSYMILDLALRQNDLMAAYTFRHRSRKKFGYRYPHVDQILRAVVTNNWVAFWRVRREVDGYLRAMMHWHLPSMRKQTLKGFARAYLKVNSSWLLESTSGSEMTWEELVAAEAVGWSLDGQDVIIRKPKWKS